MNIDSISQHIHAAPEVVYRAFVEPDALLAWLPPAGMTGVLEAFEAGIGGGYRIRLSYIEQNGRFRGKTTETSDVVQVAFVALEPARRIVEAVTFVSDDPAFAGEMRITITFDATAGGTRVTMAFSNLPKGLRVEDNAEGARISLAQLARYLER